MISEVHIRNYRSLWDLKIRLTPLTVIVGANGAGKSSLLRALAKGGSLPQDPTFGHSAGSTRRIVTAAGHELNKMPANFQGQLLDLRLDELRRENRVGEANLLSSNGDNFANLLSSLGRRQLESLAREFTAVVPLFSDVDVRPTRDGRHEVRFQDRWKQGIWYGPKEVSDGSFLALCLLALRYQEPVPSLLAIEDPDRGLHPYLYEQLINRLRDFAGNGERTKVVISTHNPSLLDCVKLDEVRFIRRNPTSGYTELTEVVGSDDWREFFRVHDDRLGDAWLTGALGGVPVGPTPDTEAAEE